MASPHDSPTRLSESVLRFLSGRHFAIVSTINPDGSPHQAVIWYRMDGDTIVINSAEGRRWPSNLRRDSRISFAIEEGVAWLGVSGTVEVVDDQPTAQADIAAMAYAYDDPEDARRAIEGQFQRQRRVSFRIRPTRVHAELPE